MSGCWIAHQHPPTYTGEGGQIGLEERSLYARVALGPADDQQEGLLDTRIALVPLELVGAVHDLHGLKGTTSSVSGGVNIHHRIYITPTESCRYSPVAAYR